MKVRPRRCRTLLAVIVVMLGAGVLAARVPGPLDKSLFVAVVDADGRPVKGVVLGDILIREDEKDREVVAVKPASQPISVAVLVDTAQGARVKDAYGTPEEYVRDLRVAIGGFAKQLLMLSPDASVMLMEFGQAAIPMVKFTTDPLAFDKGVHRIVSRPGVGSVLGEALEAANQELIDRPGTRRAIVTLNLEPSDEQSFDNANSIKDAFRKSGAQLWSLSVQRGGLKASRRDVVLNDFARLSGGKRDFIVGISAAENILKSYANALAMQYEVVYKRPETARNVKVIQVGTLLQNVKVHASGFAPQ
jgi:hypothetical protein